MRVLAIETSGSAGSVAVAEDHSLLAAIELPSKIGSARTLAPALRSILEQVGWKPIGVELVAVTVGPGSFTGLRVGVATAKTFAYATGAAVLGIDTLEAIANQVPEGMDRVSVALDAQRGDVVAADFVRDGPWMRPTSPWRLQPSAAWLEEAAARGVAVTGPILARLAERIPQALAIVDQPLWTPQALTVARLAARDASAGRRDDLWKLVPRYSRRAAAEEKADQMNGPLRQGHASP